MAQLGEVPSLGAEVTLPLVSDDELDRDDDDEVSHTWRFTVTELDGRRAARVRAERLPDEVDGTGVDGTDPTADGPADGPADAAEITGDEPVGPGVNGSRVRDAAASGAEPTRRSAAG